MCGIVGKYYFKNHFSDVSLLKKQVNSIEHRGPDDKGVWFNQQVGLGHVRLSILDLSKQGHQPMVTNDKKGVIIYNGEVYNSFEVKKEISQKHYRSSTDTEVVLNALHEKGADALSKLEGMFAFGYYNIDKNELIVARDSFGVKPLYYTYNEERLVFSSEIKPLLMEPDVTKEVDEESLKEYFLLGYSIDPNTCYKQIKRLPAGHFLQVNQSGFKIKRYFGVTDLINQNIDAKDWYEVFLESIKLQSNSDVPLGLLLSGGLDSTLILKSLKDKGLIDNNFSSYNAGLDGNGKSKTFWERHVAVQSSNFYGTKLAKISSDAKTFRSFSNMINIIEEPISNPSNYLIDKICNQAKINGHKVLLSGHGGDEIFAGYRRHLLARYLPVIKKAGLLTPLRLYGSIKHNTLYYRIKEAIGAKNNHSLFPLVAVGLDLVKKLNLTDGWMNELDLERISSKLLPNTIDVNGLSSLKKQMVLEFETYLPSQNLINMDKISMHHSIEVRVPFLYKPLVALGLNMPDKDLIQGTKTKAPFRNRGSELLPDFVTNKPKSGFGPSLKELIQTDEIRDIVYSSSFSNGGRFKSEIVKKHFYGRNVSVNEALQLMNIVTVEQWVQNQ